MRRITPSLVFRFTTLVLVAAGCSADSAPTAADARRSGSGPSRPAWSITVSPAQPSVAVGDTVRLSATVRDRSGQIIRNSTVAWKSLKPAVATVTSNGVVKGVAQGSVSIQASIGSLGKSVTIAVTAAVPPAKPQPPADSTPTKPPTPTNPASWTYCVAAGAPCEFIGLRDVRLVAPNGAFVEQTAFHIIPCAVYGFGNRHPVPGGSYTALHCEYGPIKTTTLNNPMPGMGGLGATVTVALGSPGVGMPQTRSSGGTPPASSGDGSFRTTCSLAKFAFEDPIVYPGQPNASHLHAFFGNTDINAYSTNASITSSGNSTCRGGTLNRTGYWVPAVVDSRTGEVQTPAEGVFYYKTGYNMPYDVIRTIPAGLRMIAGNKNATGAQPYVDWGCRDRYVQSTGAIPTVCPVGDAVRLTIQFPQCWDGKNLDSPNHMSHMAYPIYRNLPQKSSCPPSHPIAIPAITEHFDYPVTATTRPEFWRLSSDMYAASMKGGYSAHADWMNGWDAATLNTIVTRCLNPGRDCGVGSIGDGRDLF